MQPTALGRFGETLAIRFLEGNDYQILHTNWRYKRYGEVDIIAYHPITKTLAFVEVKSRTSNRYGTPLEAVTPKKQNTIRTIAEVYIQQMTDSPLPYKNISFDVIAIESHPGEAPHIKHYPAAF